MATDTATKIQLRRDSSANWFAKNPVLAEGEIGIELDKNRMKVGNGVNAYNDLEYFSDTVDYNEMINKPQINSVGLIGNLSLHELGIQAEGEYATSLMLTEGLAKKADKEDTYTKTEIDTEFSSIVRLPSIDGHDGEWLHVKDGTILWESLSNTVVTNEDLAKTLETYALKTDIPTKTSELTNDSGFLTSIPEEYVTETELASKGYATVDSVNNKADKATTLSGYGITDAYTKTESDGKYALQSSLNTYATKEELNNKADETELSNYLTKTDASSTYATQSSMTTELAKKADTSTLSNYLTKTDASSTYATKAELSSKADTSALPASTSLMNGSAPTVSDISTETVTDIAGLINAINEILAQLRTRNVIE